MRRQDVRVIVASEYPEAQGFLQKVVEKEQGVVTVGKAKDAYETLSLARDLRPDFAVIDFYLPHVSSLDTTIPLSRMGGLDAAQTISEEFPSTKVILLNNLNREILSHLNSGYGATFSTVSKGADDPFTLHNLFNKLVSPDAIVFVNVEVKPKPLFDGRKRANLYDKAILLGGLGLVGGGLLAVTVIFVPAGVSLALAGVVTLFLGVVGKLTPKIWRRLYRKEIK